MDRALVILTNTSGIDRLEDTNHWRPVVLRTDMDTIDQILFLNCDTGTIDRVALLNGETPFQEIQLGKGNGRYFMPQIVHVMDNMLDVQIDTACLRGLQLIGALPMRNHEPFAIDEVDELMFCDFDEATEVLIASIHAHRASDLDHTTAVALRWIKINGLNKIALREELTGTKAIDGDELEELPQNCANVPEEQREGLLFLLNSAFCETQIEA